MSKSHAGKKHSSESKEKIHISLLGKKHPHVGTKHSLESKEKMCLSQLRKKHSMEAILEINKNYLRKKLLLCAKILKHYLERNMTR